MTRERLQRMLEAPWALERVLVFSTALDCIVGHAGEFELIGEDVWAWLDIEDDTPQAKRAAAAIARRRDGDRLVAVIYTNLSREDLRSL